MGVHNAYRTSLEIPAPGVKDGVLPLQIFPGDWSKVVGEIEKKKKAHVGFALHYARQFFQLAVVTRRGQFLSAARGTNCQLEHTAAIPENAIVYSMRPLGSIDVHWVLARDQKTLAAEVGHEDGVDNALVLPDPRALVSGQHIEDGDGGSTNILENHGIPCVIKTLRGSSDPSGATAPWGAAKAVELVSKVTSSDGVLATRTAPASSRF